MSNETISVKRVTKGTPGKKDQVTVEMRYIKHVLTVGAWQVHDAQNTFSGCLGPTLDHDLTPAVTRHPAVMPHPESFFVLTSSAMTQKNEMKPFPPLPFDLGHLVFIEAASADRQTATVLSLVSKQVQEW